MLLLILLLAATGLLLLFGGWYLLIRKPISELPLPGITVEPVPHYSYSIYDVVAPTGVAVNADGSRIYATQSEGDPMVIAFDASGKQVASLKPPATATGDHVPVYVAVNPVNGEVYVSDRPAATIYVYAADGSYLRAFDPGPDLKGWQPLGLGFDTKGDLFVTSVGAPFQAVHEFAPDGTLVRTYGKADEFNFPNGVAVDANGNVYVADSNNGRLVMFDRDGNELGMVRQGAGVGDLGLPRGTAIDDSGRIYVADLFTAGSPDVSRARDRREPARLYRPLRRRGLGGWRIPAAERRCRRWPFTCLCRRLAQQPDPGLDLLMSRSRRWNNDPRA